MSEDYVTVLESVLGDVRRTTELEPTIGLESWSNDDRLVSCMLVSKMGLFGVAWERDAPECEQIAAVASQLQDWAIEMLWGVGETNWPVCPEHPTTHPMSAGVCGSTASWYCPLSGTPSTAIGSLGKP